MKHLYLTVGLDSNVFKLQSIYTLACYQILTLSTNNCNALVKSDIILNCATSLILQISIGTNATSAFQSITKTTVMYVVPLMKRNFPRHKKHNILSKRFELVASLTAVTDLKHSLFSVSATNMLPTCDT